jgi:hypothetical protein
MGLISGIAYNPGTAASVSTASLLAMTAVDTTNLRITFTVPASGKVLVRLALNHTGATTPPTALLGILQSTTVIARATAMADQRGGASGTGVDANSQIVYEATWVIDGLTPAASLTWDAAYGIEVAASAGGVFKWGGPNNTSGPNAWGVAIFEIYDASRCLAVANYDPSTAASKATTSAIALTALDTTNLRKTFTVPANGIVGVRLGCCVQRGSLGYPIILLGVLESTTVRGVAQGHGGVPQNSPGSTNTVFMEARYLVTGLTAAASLTWDAAYAVQQTQTSTNIKYGGPNNTTTNDAWGAFSFEIWDVS